MTREAIRPTEKSPKSSSAVRRSLRVCTRCLETKISILMATSCTQDLGVRDGGRLFVGRAGEMIKTSNANVSPAEVEMELQLLPGVASACVVGLPHPERGSSVAAAEGI